MLRALVRLTRPVNGVITMVAVALGYFLADGQGPVSTWLIAGLSAAAIASAGNVLNDIVDLEIDRLNRPHRPLPNGLVSRSVAGVFAALLAGAGMLLAHGLGMAPFVFAGAVLVLLAVYDVWLKRTPVLGNVVVSAVAASCLPYGGLVAGDPVPTYVVAGFAFLIHLAREILKDVEDRDGDRLAGARTLPVIVGPHRAVSAVLYLLFVLVVVSPIPHLVGLYDIDYVRMIFVMDAALITVMLRLHREPSRANLGRMSSALKLLMVLGIVAVYVG